MKRRIVLLIAGITLLASARAQEKGAEVKKQISEHPKVVESAWQGYIVDAKTAAELAKHPETALEKAAAYTREQALKMQTNGFGIFIEGKWLKFDEPGNRQVLALLKNTTSEEGILVDVTGLQMENLLAVKFMKEHKREDAPRPVPN